jgi:hypothetical protein
MAEKKTRNGGSNSLSTMPSKENVKLGDIHTAAKSSMEPHDYSEGYPAGPGSRWNGRTVTRSKGKK